MAAFPVAVVATLVAPVASVAVTAVVTALALAVRSAVRHRSDRTGATPRPSSTERSNRSTGEPSTADESVVDHVEVFTVDGETDSRPMDRPDVVVQLPTHDSAAPDHPTDESPSANTTPSDETPRIEE